MACEWNNFDIIKLIMEDERVDPSAYKNYVFRCAYKESKWMSIRTLMEDDRVVAGCIKYNQGYINEEDQRRIFEEKPHLLV